MPFSLRPAATVHTSPVWPRSRGTMAAWSQPGLSKIVSSAQRTSPSTETSISTHSTPHKGRLILGSLWTFTFLVWSPASSSSPTKTTWPRISRPGWATPDLSILVWAVESCTVPTPCAEWWRDPASRLSPPSSTAQNLWRADTSPCRPNRGKSVTHWHLSLSPLTSHPPQRVLPVLGRGCAGGDRRDSASRGPGSGCHLDPEPGHSLSSLSSFRIQKRVQVLRDKPQAEYFLPQQSEGWHRLEVSVPAEVHGQQWLLWSRESPADQMSGPEVSQLQV